MLKANTTPSVCTTTENVLSLWFVYLKVIMNHPLFNEDEKSLWWWLATLSANDVNCDCTFSYQQLSQTLNMPCMHVHRALFRFRIMGFLKTKIPVWYGKLTPEMESEMRILIPTMPPIVFDEQLTAKDVKQVAHHSYPDHSRNEIRLNLFHKNIKK